MALVAYQPLLGGSYTRPDRPFTAQRGYAHPTAYARYEALRQISQELNATPNQVILSWMLHQSPSLVPLFGPSSLTQLDEALAALDLELDADVLDRLTNARPRRPSHPHVIAPGNRYRQPNRAQQPAIRRVNRRRAET
jgi:aryl-alcohol dehydrogenase-like predicted oxidoreductase